MGLGGPGGGGQSTQAGPGQGSGWRWHSETADLVLRARLRPGLPPADQREGGRRGAAAVGQLSRGLHPAAPPGSGEEMNVDRRTARVEGQGGGGGGSAVPGLTGASPPPGVRVCVCPPA